MNFIYKEVSWLLLYDIKSFVGKKHQKNLHTMAVIPNSRTVIVGSTPKLWLPITRQTQHDTGETCLRPKQAPCFNLHISFYIAHFN